MSGYLRKGENEISFMLVGVLRQREKGDFKTQGRAACNWRPYFVRRKVKRRMPL